MARARGTKQYQPLIGGLNTEASPLDFPQGATVDELNFEYDNQDKKRVKRKGLRPRTGIDLNTALSMRFRDLVYWEARDVYLMIFTNVEEGNFSRFVYIKVLNSDLDTEIGEVADAGSSVRSWSGNTLSYTFLGDRYFIFTSDSDELSEDPEFFGPYRSTVGVIEVDGKNWNFYTGSLYFRDFELLNGGEINVRGPHDEVPTPNYYWNLGNAGWAQSKDDGSGNVRSMLTTLNLANIDYPALSEVPYTSYLTDPNSGTEYFSKDEYVAGDTKGGLAPRGHYVLEQGNPIRSDGNADINSNYPTNPLVFKNGFTED